VFTFGSGPPITASVRPREIPVSSSAQWQRPETVARLEAVRRLAMGVAHTLNNAFTTVIGEASFMLEDRKHDGLVVEGCQTILAELERCSKLTRALQARRDPNQAGSAEVDMVRLVRELGELLPDTLGRQNQLAVSLPDDLLLVRGDAGDLELLVLTLVHYAVDHAGGPTRITLSLDTEPAEGKIQLDVAVEGSALPDALAAAVLDPSRAPDEIASASLESAARIVRAHGGSSSASATGPDSWAARVSLPALPDGEV
jgi:signal transduction histidine kinase